MPAVSDHWPASVVCSVTSGRIVDRRPSRRSRAAEERGGPVTTSTFAPFGTTAESWRPWICPIACCGWLIVPAGRPAPHLAR